MSENTPGDADLIALTDKLGIERALSWLELGAVSDKWPKLEVPFTRAPRL